jgi:hypothetical protein
MSVTAFATVVQDAFDKTYPRDNTFCQIGQKRIEIMIRGFQSHTEPKERMWGDNVFARGPEGKISRIPVTQEQSGIYRFFSGNPSSCTKGVGSMVGKRFAMLFQKHNSPSKHKVVIQYLDPVTLEPLETVYTPYLSDKARVTKTGLVLRTFPPARQEMQMGKVMIGGKKYLYQDHLLPLWVSLDKDGFTTEPAETFANFTYRGFFRNVDEFKHQSGWDESAKSFSRTKLYVAINHASKSRCILLIESKKNLTGEENWICQ